MGAVTIALLLSLGPPAQARADDPAALAAALQRKYETVRDFSTDFAHTYEGGVLRKKTTERGRLLVSKPGRMRWTYDSPEEKVFVSDGRKIYSYLPADRQVYVADVPPEDRAPTPALFLAGRGNLVRDFVPSATTVEGAPAGSVALKLTPRRREAEYDWLVLVVDRETLSLRMLVTVDAQGGRSTFVFTGLRENAGIPDREFNFRIPRGVDVISN